MEWILLGLAIYAFGCWRKCPDCTEAMYTICIMGCDVKNKEYLKAEEKVKNREMAERQTR